MADEIRDMKSFIRFRRLATRGVTASRPAALAGAFVVACAIAAVPGRASAQTPPSQDLPQPPLQLQAQEPQSPQQPAGSRRSRLPRRGGRIAGCSTSGSRRATSSS